MAVIPARYGSTRFPGKALACQTGKYLIQHVYERVAAARMVDRVLVATDDERICEAVSSFGGEVVMTSPDHASGTDRVAEAVGRTDCEVVVNVQGDEPELEPEAIDRLVTTLRESDCPMATLACAFSDVRRVDPDADPSSADRVKIVISSGRALYFSRSLVPFVRHENSSYEGPFLHVGIYAYRRAFLLEFAGWPPTMLERLEGLEQLRALEHGCPIAVAVVERAAAGVDTPADYEAFVGRFKRGAESN